MSRFTAGNRFIRGWIALQRGQYEEAAEFLAERTRRGQPLPGARRHARRRARTRAGHARAQQLLRRRRRSGHRDRGRARAAPDREPRLRAAGRSRRAPGARRSARWSSGAEYGPRYRLAQALRRRASFEPARQAVGLLAEAVELAESTPRRPVTARVLASYGAALRRVDRIPEAREALYRAVDLAGEMGMERLRERAHQELVLAGGRPRRTRTTGPAVADRGPAAGGAPGRERAHATGRSPRSCSSRSRPSRPTSRGLPEARHRHPRRARRRCSDVPRA